MDAPDSPPQRRIVLPQPIDPMGHFARDKPGVKLCALVVTRLPAILTAAGGLGGLVLGLRHFM
jgi:hypothetical protein